MIVFISLTKLAYNAGEPRRTDASIPLAYTSIHTTRATSVKPRILQFSQVCAYKCTHWSIKELLSIEFCDWVLYLEVVLLIIYLGDLSYKTENSGSLCWLYMHMEQARVLTIHVQVCSMLMFGMTLSSIQHD